MEKFLREYETHGSTNTGANQRGYFNAPSAKSILAERAEVDPTYITKIINLQVDGVDFWLADRLLAAMDMQLSWHADPELAEHFWPEGDRPPDESKTQRCANPECDEWFSVAGALNKHGKRGGGQQRYCSSNCSTSHRRREAGRRNMDIECKNGHDRATTPQYIGSKGERICSRCRKEAQSDTNARRKEARREA